MSSNLRLFHVPPIGPQGLRYKPDFITCEEEKKLLELFKNLPLKTWVYKGYESKKRVMGWDAGEKLPPLIKIILKRSAHFAGVLPSSIDHILLSEYSAGTQIGWHQDRGPYKNVIGISLCHSAILRFRRPYAVAKSGGGRRAGKKFERFNITAEPRSIYIMAGASQRLFQHSVAPVKNLRYSLTMRSLEKPAKETSP